MVRKAEIRKRRYEKSLHPERIGAKFEGLKPVMVEQESRYLAQIAHVEAKVKQVCEAAGVPTYEVAQYINFGRQVWTLADRFSGDTLAAEVQWLVNHWGSRGLDGALLLVIAGFWGVTPTPPVPPQHGNERHTPDFLPVDGTLPMTGPLSIEAPADADAIMLGAIGYEGGNISIYRNTVGNKQFFLDADALENATALTLYGRARVGTTDPVEVRGDEGNIVRVNTGAVFCKIATLQYTGNGAASLAITGVGFRPRFVRITLRLASDAGQYVFEKSDQTPTTYCVVHHPDYPYHRSWSGSIISLDADGFTVGNSAGGFANHPNANGQVYEVQCYG